MQIFFILLMYCCKLTTQFYKRMVFFIPGTDSKIFQGARRVFTFHIEIFSLLSELANSVMKRSKCEKWKLFKPLEKFKRKGLGWVKCFLRQIEIYLYAIIYNFDLPRKVNSYKEIISLVSLISLKPYHPIIISLF